MSKPLFVVLPPAHREHLRALTHSGSSSARIQTRARILLLADRSQGEHRSHEQIADALCVSGGTISATCRRYALEGLESALSEKPRPGQAPKITGEIEAQLVLLACSDPPEGQARWTMQLLANKMIELKWVESITDTTVCERLKKKRAQAVANQAVLYR